MAGFDWSLPYPSQREPVLARNVVATSQPLAAQAGLQGLRDGGNAIDAAVAAAMTLTVVEPTSNGIGSDAFAVIWAGRGLHGLNASGRSPRGLARERFDGLAEVPRLGWDATAQVLDPIVSHQWPAAVVVVAGGALFCVYYIAAYRRLVRGGYRISRQKIAFLLSVGSTSIAAWGFLPPLEAFFVANLFHNVQYFGIVWWAEKHNIRRVFGLSRLRGGQAIALLAYLGSMLFLAAACESGTRQDLRWALSLGLVVTLMHFWYDGFIWSVRRREVGPA